MRTVLVLCAVLSLTACGHESAAADEGYHFPPEPPRPLVHVPGTHVSVPVPEGYEASDDFAGFANQALRSSILVLELAPHFEEALAAWDDEEALAQRELLLLGKSELVVDGHRASLAHLEQLAPGNGIVGKWVLLVDHPEATVQVLATCPKEFVLELDVLEDALRGIVLDPLDDPLEALPYEVSAAGPYRVATVFGRDLLLTPGGSLPVDDPGGASFSVSASLAPVAPDVEPRDFLALRLRELPHVASLHLEACGRVSEDQSGRTFEAVGLVQTTSGESRLCYGRVLFEEDRGYLLAVGLAPAEERARQLPWFREMAASVRRKVR